MKNKETRVLPEEHRRRIREAFREIDKKDLAFALGKSVTYIRQITGGLTRVSATRALEIQRAAKREGIALAMRPDIFG